MSKIFAHATPKNPCTICGNTDWCTFGDRAQLCQRVESDKPHPKGGWWHFYDQGKSNLKVTIPKARVAPKELDAEDLMESIYNAPGNSREVIFKLADELGVNQPSLINIRCAFFPKYAAYAFPMSDGDGKNIGIRLRNNSGEKWAVTGSRQGIFLPTFETEDKIAFLPEGPTDTAALLTMGLYAIGRPTCTGGNDLIAQALKRLGIRKAVIVADNDELKQLGPRQGRPGIEGALKLKKELGLPSVIWIPPAPIKDARAFLKAGGTKEMILADIKNKVWTK
jgi:hypothetical protein